MRLAKIGLIEPAYYKFIIFLVILGFGMPNFSIFDYYFYLDVQKIPLEMINLQSLYSGWLVVLIPYLYQNFFHKREFVYMLATA